MDCYQLHYRRLVRALEIAGVSSSVAEDLAQEAFSRLLTHWCRVRSGQNPAGYAYRCAFRLLNRRRLVDQRQPQGPMPAASGDGVGEGDPQEMVTTRIAVAGVLAAMPAKRRACAVMCLVVGLPTSAAAESLGMAEGTVRKHLSQARLDLHAMLDDRQHGKH